MRDYPKKSNCRLCVAQLLWAMLVIVLATAQGVGDEKTESSSSSTLKLNGQLDQRYRFRKSGFGEDQDLYGSLRLGAVYPSKSEDERRSVFERLGFDLQASYNLDIDSFARSGKTPGSSLLPFADATNAFSDRFRGFVHSAYGEVEGFAGLDQLRLGRQSVYREEGLLFDGAYLRTDRHHGLSLDVYGGLPVHLYEASSSGDALAGTGVDWRPIRGLSIGLDYIFLRDRREEFGTEEDHVYLVRGRYRIDDEWNVGASASWADTRDRRQMVDIRYSSLTSGLFASLRLMRQNGIVGFQSNELSPFLLIQGEYAPFYQVQFDIQQPLGEHFAVNAGLNARQLEKESASGLYNRDFRNVYASIDTEDLWPGGQASLRLDGWESEGDDFFTTGFEVEQKLNASLRMSAGTSYSLYRLDLFSGVERENNRVYYLKIRSRLKKQLELTAGYQYERDSDTEYHTVTTGLRLWF